LLHGLSLEIVPGDAKDTDVIIRRFVKSRKDEVQQWYEQHGPALVAYACSILGDRGSAEDVLQQVFLKLLKGKIEVPRSAVKPYLFRAVRNTAISLGGQNSRNVALEDETGGQWFEAPIDLMHWSAKLESAIRELPVEQSEVLTMKIWGEMTFDEIATVLEVPMNTVASRYRYAIAKLRELMQLIEVQNEHAK
jgi:RNA polymerase sigma-70 factor, ECF subfamily